MLDAEKILVVLRRPGIVRAGPVAVRLGLTVDAVRFLTKEGHIDALGATEGVELAYDSDYIEELAHNHKWKVKALTADRSRIGKKNQKQKAKAEKKKIEKAAPERRTD